MSAGTRLTDLKDSVFQVQDVDVVVSRPNNQTVVLKQIVSVPNKVKGTVPPNLEHVSSSLQCNNIPRVLVQVGAPQVPSSSMMMEKRQTGEVEETGGALS